MALRPINGISLCAGIGGLDLGLAAILPAYRTVCYVEGEAYAAAVLVARMAEKQLDQAPIWSDVRTFDGVPWRGCVDIISAGYPCQPFSVAGKRGGDKDPRHLWPHVARIIGECQPACVFLENVAGHASKGLDIVWGDLRRLGYTVEAGYFSASEVGAPHIRNRLFILAANAHSGELWQQQQRHQKGREANPVAQQNGVAKCLAHADRSRCRQGESKSTVFKWGERTDGGGLSTLAHANRQGGLQQGRAVGTQRRGLGNGGEAIPDADRARLEKRRAGPHANQQPPPIGNDRGEVEPRFRRMVDGIPAGLDSRMMWAVEIPGVPRVVRKLPQRVDRLRALGNAVVPQCAAYAFKTLWEQMTCPK